MKKSKKKGKFPKVYDWDTWRKRRLMELRRDIKPELPLSLWILMEAERIMLEKGLLQ